MKLRLVRPAWKYRDSFARAWEEGRTEGRYSIYQKQPEWRSYLSKQRQLPNTKWWWIIDGNNYIGRVGIRRIGRKSGDVSIEIRPSMRGLGYGSRVYTLIKRKARAMGKKQLRVVCRENNEPSRRMIENWGGMFRGRIKRRNKEDRLEYEVKL